jgi:hypothetical protein
MPTRAVLAVIVLALVLPARAGADPLPAQPYASKFTRDSLSIAASFFGRSPSCTGGVRITIGRLAVNPQTGAGAFARTYGSNPCRIDIDPLLFEVAWNYDGRIWACGIIVHEFGHLLGLMHDNRRYSIMAEGGGEGSTVRGCYRRFKPHDVSRKQDRRRYGYREFARPPYGVSIR